MLSVGQTAPPFELDSTTGKRVRLSDLRGRKTVLYFYPRDDTPGCTREACDFRDRIDRVQAAGAQVLGVSSDNLDSHGRFRAKYNLPFELLADPGNQVAAAYGAYGEREKNGAMVVGTTRSTFVIDENGQVAAMWAPVKVDGHADEVLAALNQASSRANEVSDAVKEGVAAAKSLRTASSESAQKSRQSSAAASPARASKQQPAQRAAAKPASAGRKPAKSNKEQGPAKSRAKAAPQRAPKKTAGKLRVVTLRAARKTDSKASPAPKRKGATAARRRVARKGR